LHAMESSDPMKPTPKSELPPLLAFGSHPDDVEFGCGGVLVKEARAGRPIHLVVCSRGEAATHGTPTRRALEARHAARLLRASLQFIHLDGDAHLEIRAAHAIKLAAIIRRTRPALVLAPTLDENQHPDHWRLARLVRDAARLARYGGVKELKKLPPHAIGQLFHYAVTTDPPTAQPILVDVSAPEILSAWTAAMQAYSSQTQSRNYIELALTRARLHGLSAGVGHAIALYAGAAPVVDTLEHLQRSARGF